MAFQTGTWEWVSAAVKRIKVEPSVRTRTAATQRLARRVRRSLSTSVPAVTIEDLSSLLTDRDDSVRFWAAMALGYLGPRAGSAIPALEQALRSVAEDRSSLSSAEAMKFALTKIKRGEQKGPTKTGKNPAKFDR
jgi:HEAT repeat protein